MFDSTFNPKDQRLHPPMEGFEWQIGDLLVRWFGIRIGNNPFHKSIQNAQTTNPNHQFTIPSVGWKNVESLNP